MNHDGKAVSSEYRRFFAELVPRLDTARTLDRELDRNLARRFNVLDYLKTDELGLSRIIADLLNPTASHGQNLLFLRILLDRLRKMRPRTWPDLDRSEITVVVERRIAADRRIDISVQIGEGDKRYCLAIENKPYAGDQVSQVRDYLKFLEKEYRGRFLLIYLSPTGEGPSESSIRKVELQKKWTDRFVIMPYHRGSEEQTDEFRDFRLPDSLADWLGECRMNCEVDRVRWFLRDAEVFCRRIFGGQSKTNDSETAAVRDFVLSSPDNLRTALAVQESWLAIKKSVCNSFLERLCEQIMLKIESDVGSYGDLCVGYEYGGESRWSSIVWLYRKSWARYSVEAPAKHQRTSIALNNGEVGPNGWIIGVLSPISKNDMVDGDKKRRLCLETALKQPLDQLQLRRTSPRWPWYGLVPDRRNWNPLIPDLHHEREQAGEITKYFVDRFAEVAEKAIRIINKIEGNQGSRL